MGVSSPIVGQDFVVRESTALDLDLAPVSLTIDDAVQIALTRSYVLRQNDLDLQDADWQVKEVYGSAYPQLSLNSNYRRNIVTPNPFAGSDAGGFFASLTSIDWLAYNETQRLDDDPLTGPITLKEYRGLRVQGIEDA
ncbi:MAG: TolC family protein, partial [Rhodothermia bacterium]